MTRRVIAFDLDDTLAVTKSPISDQMGELLVKLLQKFEVCIISGGKFEQFKKQVVDRLEASPQELSRLHLMPTCGTRYYRYEDIVGEWKQQYAEDLSEADKKRIIKVLEVSAKKLGLWVAEPYGNIIEDRGSQITYSALGQKAPADEKYKWADENAKAKQDLKAMVSEALPELEVRLGGTTSVDITRIGIDKAYGMRKLIEQLSVAQDDILFVGDKLQEGGNDYPVKAMGIDCIEVEKWEDTIYVIEGILATV